MHTGHKAPLSHICANKHFYPQRCPEMQPTMYCESMDIMRLYNVMIKKWRLEITTCPTINTVRVFIYALYTAMLHFKLYLMVPFNT